jgi:hypothetical protein
MIVKIFDPVKGFPGVWYNLNKVEHGKAELMKAANFGALGAMSKLRIQDYQDYFQQLASLNKRTVYPQLHATISAEGHSSTKEELTAFAEKWLELMGYGAQPYLIVFHKDTDNNHVHVVTSRIDRNGKKINSAFEHNRSIKALNQVVGLDEDLSAKKDLKDALSYKFSTNAQLMMILETRGYAIKDGSLIKFGRKLMDIPAADFNAPPKQRAKQLKAIFEKYRQRYSAQLEPQDGKLHKFRSDLADFLRVKLGVELIFHSSNGKPAYGYTVIDHAQKNVFKGSEVMLLKDLLAPAITYEVSFTPGRSAFEPAAVETSPVYEAPIRISIADDVDDQQIHGMRRRRQKKARTNTR